MINSAGGRFAINTTTGQLTVSNGSLLNFEASSNHTIVVRTTDAAGLTFDQTMTVSVTDVNETPTALVDTATAVEAGGVSNGTAGTNPTGNVLSNDTDVDAGDTRTVTGVAAGTVASASTNVGSAVTGSFGSINIAADGSYTYTVDNNNATVQALRNSGQTINDVFTYTMRDTAGLTSTSQITVTIQGSNDTPHDIVLGGQNLIVNGGFENNLTGWTHTGGGGVFANAGRPSEGTQFFGFNGAGSPTTGVLSQSVTTVVGATYRLSLDFQNSGWNTLQQAVRIEILDGATVIATQNIVDPTQNGTWNGNTYQSYGVTFVATGTATTIRISDQSLGENGNDADIDRVSLNLISTAASVAENATNGTFVALALGQDVDGTSTATYQLTNDAAGRFAINTNTGAITVSKQFVIELRSRSVSCGYCACN